MEVIKQLPKRNTLESAKSGLKNWTETQSRNRVIMDNGQFPLFTKMMKGLFRDLKLEGKGDTENHPPLDEASLAKVYQAIAIIKNVFKSRGPPQFDDYIMQVPEESSKDIKF